jgi:hypothetical protein
MGPSFNFVANLLCPITKFYSFAAGFFSFYSFSLLLRPDRIFLSWFWQISLMAHPEFMKLTFCHCRLFCRVVRSWMLHTHWRRNYMHLSVDVDVCIFKLCRLTAEGVTEWCSTRMHVWCIVRIVNSTGKQFTVSGPLLFADQQESVFIQCFQRGIPVMYPMYTYI